MTKRISRNRDVLSTTRAVIARIERLDPSINAVVVRDFERALADARRLDERAEPRGPLHGAVVTVKEAFDVAGLPTTLGMRANADSVAREDAEIVRRLRAAGAVVLGKTNVSAMLSDFATVNELFGRTNNPWDLSRGVGGSSGGSAAAIAAGFARIECGSDLGGSLRNPAHYCGVYAHEPTWGVVPMRGHGLPSMHPRPDMAVAGPLASNANDLALALDVLADDGALRRPRVSSLRGLRVAVWPTDAIAPVSDEIASRVQRVSDRLAARGARVTDRARPFVDAESYRATYAALVGALIGATADDAVHAALVARAAALDPGDRSRSAAFARAMVASHREWMQHDLARARFREAWRRFFEEHDVLVCPVMPTVACPHDAPPALDQVFWASLASLCGLPSTVFPAGLSKEGLPIGLQAIAAERDDHAALAFARLLSEDDEGGQLSPPPPFA